MTEKYKSWINDVSQHTSHAVDVCKLLNISTAIQSIDRRFFPHILCLAWVQKQNSFVYGSMCSFALR